VRDTAQAGHPRPPLLLTNIGTLLTLQGGRGPRRGRELGDLNAIANAAVLCRQGKIVAVGPEREVLKHAKELGADRDLESFDCGRGTVMPGFVDSHTHPVFAAPRLLDFEKRIQGASYQQIAEAGGGIRSSVEGVRAASEAELAQGVLAAFRHMQSSGTATVEAKSGYGLSTDAELKSLRAIRQAAGEWQGTVVSTLLGAHVVPSEFSDKPHEYVKLVCEEMIPRVASEKLAEFVDVFCERGAFTLPQTELIFDAARQHGLGVRAHVCQFSPQELSRLKRFSPASFDHLDCLSDQDLKSLAQQDTVATLLPGASYFLAHSYPPARRLIEAGAAVALATDYNPGTSPTTSMPMILSMACTQMRMTPAESISAATINGAHALRLGHSKGSIEVEKDADLAIFPVQDYREICYWFGGSACSAVVLNGVWVK
jgi:imidazolonepropionase